MARRLDGIRLARFDLVCDIAVVADHGVRAAEAGVVEHEGLDVGGEAFI